MNALILPSLILLASLAVFFVGVLLHRRRRPALRFETITQPKRPRPAEQVVVDDQDVNVDDDAWDPEAAPGDDGRWLGDVTSDLIARVRADWSARELAPAVVRIAARELVDAVASPYLYPGRTARDLERACVAAAEVVVEMAKQEEGGGDLDWLVEDGERELTPPAAFEQLVARVVGMVEQPRRAATLPLDIRGTAVDGPPRAAPDDPGVPAPPAVYGLARSR